MSQKSEQIVPRGEDLRRAVHWISEQHTCNLQIIEIASQKFDLSPLDEEFLIRNFPHRGGSQKGDE